MKCIHVCAFCICPFQVCAFHIDYANLTIYHISFSECNFPSDLEEGVTSYVVEEHEVEPDHWRSRGRGADCGYPYYPWTNRKSVDRGGGGGGGV